MTISFHFLFFSDNNLIVFFDWLHFWRNTFNRRALFPIDNYFGFYVTWLQELLSIRFYNQCFFVFLLLYIGLYSFVNAIVIDFRASALELNANLNSDLLDKKSSKSRKSLRFLENQTVILKEIIELHNDMVKYGSLSIFHVYRIKSNIFLIP